MNETSALNTSSLTFEPNDTILPYKYSDSTMLFLEARLVITSVLLTFGLFANISIILVLRGLNTATSILTIYMATFDTISLINKVIKYGFEYYYNIDIFGHVYCLVSFSSIIALVTTANWTLVLICTERFISIFFPFHYRTFVSTKRVHVTMATMLCIFVVYSILVNVTLREYNDLIKGCITINISGDNFNILINAVAVLVPSLLTTLITSLVIVKLNFSKPDSRSIQKSNSRLKLESTFSRIMVSSAILFVILTTPGTIYYCLIFPAFDYETVSPVLDISLFLLSDLSHILNFVVYVIFVKAFRKSFLEIITKKTKRSLIPFNGVTLIFFCSHELFFLLSANCQKEINKTVVFMEELDICYPRPAVLYLRITVDIVTIN
ncbi:FMRFamide receptor-like [Biomphalaria glabrata]|uniref:FMRFamide receptor-like n=1 Tax=Biomphalaria glabrata TaxID=6526 RepID=A0A9W3BPS8_BIOGL|nr:FMRFamide receptor-like [Biomphalaria glabrata]XP_055901407.1 FMRFamide receptor-like [Biomphalaria glabrata]XP_055901408.1 FMRFamide receptor-like [Biomphalaria glabrata]XP_055901409.1 FMRFamide receptor-like [Biomphalaria glabrata]